MTQTTFDAHPRSSLIVALDFDSLSTAVKFATQIADLVGMFKIGNQLFTAAGPAAVKEIGALGAGVFLDLKYHDIPNTVAGAVLSAAAMSGVELVTVHALGGKAMMEAAAQAISAGVRMGADRPCLLAVTVLTSMDHKTMKEVGIGGTPKLRVVKLAELAKKAGVDGVVASVQEAKAHRGDSRRRRLPGRGPADSGGRGPPRRRAIHSRRNRLGKIVAPQGAR